MKKHKDKKSSKRKKQIQVNSEKVTGELFVHRDGYGFVMPDDGEDVFVPARYIGDALHGDLVEVDSKDSSKKGKREGRISKIVKRNLTHLMGRLEKSGKYWQVVADDRRVKHRIHVADKKIGEGKDGDNVVVKIDVYPSGDIVMRGDVVQVLGRRGEVTTEKLAVIIKNQLEREFPPHVLAEASDVEKLMAEGLKGVRKNLRDIPFVTIDGETAEDFDDAVAAQKNEDGTIILRVSIADVSHFVRPGSRLDDEAYARGTSVYFPGDCIPMLPQSISNDMCSLRPKQDRLTMTAEMKINESGQIVDTRFYKSVINSFARMTYTDLKKIFVEDSPDIKKKYKHLLNDLMVLDECYERLAMKRRSRGSIDFDLPEPEVVLDVMGETSDILRAERHKGHMMIEEFMVAANECVAEYLTESKAGCIYRVHESPPLEKLKEFALLLHNLGYEFEYTKNMPCRILAKLVKKVSGKPEERLVNHALLRAMSQAVYSNKNLGHYGLASTCYCHFTSPIRRYPDLVVHRLLTEVIFRSSDDKGPHIYDKTNTLKNISEHCSRRERVAMHAEREMLKLYGALYMREHVGDEYLGIISHVTKFGFFVELIDVFIEGLVHIASLDDDKYHFEERGCVLLGSHGAKFKVGDKVKVEVEEVDIPNREINFLLIEKLKVS